VREPKQKDSQGAPKQVVVLPSGVDDGGALLQKTQNEIKLII
jgi:hypothetical protein